MSDIKLVDFGKKGNSDSLETINLALDFIEKNGCREMVILINSDSGFSAFSTENASLTMLGILQYYIYSYTSCLHEQE